MSALRVTTHAIERYRERVAPVTPEEAMDALMSKACQKAADFGARFVKLGTGQRILINRFGTVVTVLPREVWLETLGQSHDH